MPGISGFFINHYFLFGEQKMKDVIVANARGMEEPMINCCCGKGAPDLL